MAGPAKDVRSSKVESFRIESCLSSHLERYVQPPWWPFSCQARRFRCFSPWKLAWQSSKTRSILDSFLNQDLMWTDIGILWPIARSGTFTKSSWRKPALTPYHLLIFLAFKPLTLLQDSPERLRVWCSILWASCWQIIWQQQFFHTAALWRGWSPCFLKFTACKPPIVFTPYEAKFPLSPAELQALHPTRQGDSCRSNQGPLEGSAGSSRKRSCHLAPRRSHLSFASWLIAPRPKQPLKQWAKKASTSNWVPRPKHPILSSMALQEVAGLEQKSQRRENQIISRHATIFSSCPNENWPRVNCITGPPACHWLSLTVSKHMFLLQTKYWSGYGSLRKDNKQRCMFWS